MTMSLSFVIHVHTIWDLTEYCGVAFAKNNGVVSSCPTTTDGSATAFEPEPSIATSSLNNSLVIRSAI